MISNKGIKILCYITMTIVYILGIFLLISGIDEFSKDNDYAIYQIVASILFPLIVTVFLFPIFTLANIDENLQTLNKKVENLTLNLLNNVHQDYTNNSTNNLIDTPQIEIKQDIIDYINDKYDINLKKDSECDEIKKQILSIKDNSISVTILKEKVLLASSNNEIMLALNNHKVINE